MRRSVGGHFWHTPRFDVVAVVCASDKSRRRTTVAGSSRTVSASYQVIVFWLPSLVMTLSHDRDCVWRAAGQTPTRASGPQTGSELRRRRASLVGGCRRRSGCFVPDLYR